MQFFCHFSLILYAPFFLVCEYKYMYKYIATCVHAFVVLFCCPQTYKLNATSWNCVLLPGTLQLINPKKLQTVKETNMLRLG